MFVGVKRPAFQRLNRSWLAPLSITTAVTVALLIRGALTSEAVQSPTISLDMVTAGNSYDYTTNTMTVGAIDNCLASPTADPATHRHTAHLVVQNVEDMVAWQARFNYIGDQMRVSPPDFEPFIDNNTGQRVGFLNLPFAGGGHRRIAPGFNVPPTPPDNTNTPQTALIGAAYLGEQSFPISPDTPAKAVPDDTSYSAPTGGVLASVTLQVVGDHSGQALAMDLDNQSPNYPGSTVVVFNGVGQMTIDLPESALGDGLHAEGGASCDLPTPPPPTPTPLPPSPTVTPSPTAPPPPTPTPPPPSPTLTPSPTPEAPVVIIFPPPVQEPGSSFKVSIFTMVPQPGPGVSTYDIRVSYSTSLLDPSATSCAHEPEQGSTCDASNPGEIAFRREQGGPLFGASYIGTMTFQAARQGVGFLRINVKSMTDGSDRRIEPAGVGRVDGVIRIYPLTVFELEGGVSFLDNTEGMAVEPGGNFRMSLIGYVPPQGVSGYVIRVSYPTSLLDPSFTACTAEIHPDATCSTVPGVVTFQRQPTSVDSTFFLPGHIHFRASQNEGFDYLRITIESMTDRNGRPIDPADLGRVDGLVQVAQPKNGETRLTEPAEVGDPRIQGYPNEANFFDVGDTIVINPNGPNKEERTIVGFQDGFELDSPLARNHSPTETVQLAEQQLPTPSPPPTPPPTHPPPTPPPPPTPTPVIPPPEPTPTPIAPETPVPTPRPTGPTNPTPSPPRPIPSTVSPTPLTTPPAPGGTPVPTATRPPVVNPPKEPEVIINYRDRMKAGESAVFHLVLDFPEEFTSRDPPTQPERPEPAKPYKSKVMKTWTGDSFEIYFQPPEPTKLTLQVETDAFEISNIDDWKQEVGADDKQVRWSFTIAPRAGKQGQQDIAIKITQEIAGGAIPEDKREFFLEHLTVFIEPLGGDGSSFLSQVGSGAQWMLPAVLIPLLTLIVSIAGRETILGWIRQMRERWRHR